MFRRSTPWPGRVVLLFRREELDAAQIAVNKATEYKKVADGRLELLRVKQAPLYAPMMEAAKVAAATKMAEANVVDNQSASYGVLRSVPDARYTPSA